jgi:hypothetical protein
MRDEFVRPHSRSGVCDYCSHSCRDPESLKSVLVCHNFDPLRQRWSSFLDLEQGQFDVGQDSLVVYGSYGGLGDELALDGLGFDELV